MKRILFITYQDYANVSSSMAKAINSSMRDWGAAVFSCTSHPFGYPHAPDLVFDSADIYEKRDAKEWLKDGVDVLVWAEEAPSPQHYYSFYSEGGEFADAMLFGMKDRLFDKAKTFIFHAGVAYRYQSVEYNRLDSEFFDGQIVSPDLWRISNGLNGIPLFGKPMGYYGSHRLARDPGVVRFCHSPTNKSHKGTAIIDAAMDRVSSLRADIGYEHVGGPYHEGKHLPFDEVRRVRSGYDVYIDQFSLVGGVGMSSLEAMGEGLVSMCSTQMIPEEVWEMCGISSKDCPLIQLSGPTGDDEVDKRYLERKIIEVANSFTPYQGRRSRDWVCHHMDESLKAQMFIESLI